MGPLNPTEARLSSRRGPSPRCLLIRPSRAAPGGGDREVEAAGSRGKRLLLGAPCAAPPRPRRLPAGQPRARAPEPALEAQPRPCRVGARAVALPVLDEAKPPSRPFWFHKDCSVLSKESMGLVGGAGLQALSLTPSPWCSWLSQLPGSSPSPPGHTGQRQQGPTGIPRPPPHQSGLTG